MGEPDEMAARMLCVGFEGTRLSSDLGDMLDRGVGAVVLFRRNVETPEQVSDLCFQIKARAKRPVMICIDQEGGRVVRLGPPFTAIPSMRALGRTGNAELARAVGRVLARELRAVNVDMNLAPVLDVDSNPANPVIGQRSLGPDPDLVSRMGCALLAGLQENGVAACAKHFPGHGDTAQDSHLHLPRLNHDMSRLERVELPPFAAAVNAGVAAVMSSHVIFEPLDRQYPATMSRVVLEGILRHRMRFNGVVISDDLEMKAIADHYDLEDVVERGLEAGIDVFAICRTHHLQRRAMEILARPNNRQRLKQAVQRIEALAQHYVRPARRGARFDIIGCAEHRAVVNRIVEAVSNRLDPTES